MLIVLLLATQLADSLGWVWISMVLVVGAVVISESNGLAAVLRWRPIAHIGLVSYGVYLMHMLCYNAMKQLLPIFGITNPHALFPATVIAATFAATVSYWYYESFFLRLKRAYVRSSTR